MPFKVEENVNIGVVSAQGSDAAVVALLPVGLASLRVEAEQLISCWSTDVSGIKLGKIFAS